MKPAAFEYYSPTTLDEAFALLDEYGFDAKIISGGQSLIPMMNMRLARPKVLIDINQIPDLSYIRYTEEEIKIGGLTRHYQVEQSEDLKRICPLLTEAVKHIGTPQIRSRGTIGGSIVHADPTAELPVILSTLGGSVTLASSEGSRTLTCEEFFLTYLTTTIEMNEILVSVQIPRSTEKTGFAFEEFSIRKGDFAIVLAAAWVNLDESGKVASAALGIGGVEGVPLLLNEVTEELIGQNPSTELLEQCCHKIIDWVDPEPDIHASADYRRDLSVVYGKRALEEAIRRAMHQ